ncbi:MAG: glycogen/starch synthase [Oscillospiraceae bacterium]|nr:glycogen/starch synthase [Oscillospiraceae bacterium]
MNADLERSLFLKGRDRLPGILIAAAECSPLSKTGGLADVAGALPHALGEMGFDARVITPYHKCMKGRYEEHITHMGEFYVDLGWRHQYAGLEKLEMHGVTYYLIDSEYYFGDAIYRGGEAEVEQYAFFQRAVLNLIPYLDFEPEIIHCNDWHTAMIPMLLKVQYGWHPQGRLHSVFSIHNLAFQGWLSPESMNDLLGLEGRWLGDEGANHGGWCNFLKAGVLFADKVNTVSPSYADEICTPEFGEGMNAVLQSRGTDLCGILNGIDTVVFDPAKDKNISYHYDADHPAKKAKNKQKLLRELGLESGPETPVVAMITRMTRQKGFDLILQTIDEIMNRDVAFVLLGTGDKDYENAMRYYENRYKGRLCAYIGYSEEVARQIYAGADFLLMPSAFEPCGLSQMIAQRYGTLPIVHEVGGLRDTVLPYNRDTGEGDGFSFHDFDAGALLGAVSYALSVYQDKPAMKKLIFNAMHRDVSMEKCARDYAELYMTLADSATGEVLHNPGDPLYRTPMGAVPGGGKAVLRLKAADFATSVKLLINDKTIPMQHIGDGLLEAELDVPEMTGLAYYSFQLAEGLWYGADGMGLEPRQGWQLTIYDKNFTTPEWAEGAVMYQIFPDRFARGGSAFRKGVTYHEELGRDIEVHDAWDDPVKFWASHGPDYVPNDFYGGTLAGIEAALPDLKKRGITVLYLNPIFESASNHRYDTADYNKIDPMLGTEEDFKHLCAKAKELGMHVILDGVFSHTGDDSIYFNRYSRYEAPGAYQGKKSPYYSWYEFRNYPDGYRCWWNFPSLPEVIETDPKWQEFVVEGKDAVMKRWLRDGAGGWRLDVADELPDEVIAKMRKSVKDEDPDALIIGEVWEDATNKVSYGERRRYALGEGLDSVMNYPLRGALLDFALDRMDAKGLRDFLLRQKLHYPAPMYRCLMNHLGTHDTVRLRTVLATGLDGEGMTREEQAGYHITWEQNHQGRLLQRLLAAVQFALPGMPCIYYGDEEGMTGFRDPFCRGPYTTAYRQESLRDFYAELARIRNESEALKKGDAAFASYGRDVLVVLRWVKGETVLVGVNRSDKVAEVIPHFKDFQGLDIQSATSVSLLPPMEIPPMDYVIARA